MINRYVAFFRGVNVSGKNKVAMSELKNQMSELGFSDVATYLNSGNVIFSCENTDEILISDKIRSMISSVFGIDIPVFVILQSELTDILSHSPDWWGDDNKEIYDNLIFIIPPATYNDIYESIGEPKDCLEKIESYKNVIFWSFSRKDYQKTNWWSKTAAPGIGEKLTIRTANTLRKISTM
ncbi:MAG: DUF1697 domain-containing protein [Acutalibacteraceae bacterium]